MGKRNNKLSFTLVWSSCIFVLFLLIGLGVSSSSKGTSAVEYNCSCSEGKLYANGSSGYCSMTSYEDKSGWTCTPVYGDYNIISYYNCTTAATCTPVSDSTEEDSGDDTTGDTEEDEYPTGCVTVNPDYDKYSCSPSGAYDAITGAACLTCYEKDEENPDAEEVPAGCVTVNPDTTQYSCTPNGLYDITGVNACLSCVKLNTIFCSPGKYYTGQGSCATCLAGYYCEGGSFNESDSSRAGLTECPSGTTSSAGVSSVDDCETTGSSEKIYTINYNGNNGNVSMSSDTCTVKSGATSCSLTIKATASRDGYYFNGWSTNSSSCTTGISVGTEVTLSKSSTTYYACWKEIVAENFETLTATFDASGTGGSVTTKTCQIPKGTSGTNECTVTAPSGSWYIIHSDGDSSEVYCTNPVNGGETIRLTTNITYKTCPKSTDAPSDNPSSVDTPSDDTPSDDTPEDNTTSETSKDENVEENPKTGEIAIFVVWVMAAMAIVYSVWYFKQVRES